MSRISDVAMGDQFPNCCADVISNAQNIYVIANNSWLSRSILCAIKPSKTDVVVQFNACMHYNYFKNSVCVKFYIFRQDDQSDRFWGFDLACHRISGEPGRVNCVFVFNREIDRRVVEKSLIRIADVFDECSMVADGGAPQSFEAVYDPSSGGRISPTTGYLSLRLIFECIQVTQSRAKLIAVGFSGNPISLWSGHQMDHERRWLEGSGVQRITHSRTKEFVDRSRHRIWNILRLVKGFILERVRPWACPKR